MKIQFMPASQLIEETTESPLPSKICIPDWYKKIMPSRTSPNVKSCPPFLDALMHGYTQRTWVDIFIEETADGIEIKAPHPQHQKLLDFRETNDLPAMEGYLDFQFVWQQTWSPIFPPNFSGLITHPLNRIDLPFYTFGAVIDFDKFRHVPYGNFPFYLKKGFFGVIPKGTPMYQIIPLAREDWEATAEKYDEAFWNEKMAERAAVMPNFYKKKIWEKKEFKMVAE